MNDLVQIQQQIYVVNGDRILLMTPGKGIQLDTAENLKKANAFTSAFGMDIFNPLG